MKLQCLAAAVVVLFALPQISFSQGKNNIKFGKITPSDFDLSKEKFDTGAHAVILADIGSSKFEGNTKGWFSLIFRRHKRLIILDKSALDEADVEVPLYTNGSATETITDLKAFTYSLEDGKVVSTKLENNGVFKEKHDKNYQVKKFSLPGVKVGCIVEYTYTVKSDFFTQLQPWEFQCEYPCLWSEYSSTIPEYFVYVFLAQGDQNFSVNERSTSMGHYNVLVGGNTAEASEHLSLTANEYTNHFVKKNIPALKDEPFTSSRRNFVSKITYQLSQIRLPNEPPEDYMSNWMLVNEKLNKAENFGADLQHSNGWLDDELKMVTHGTTDSLKKAQLIYEYVRENFSCTEDQAINMEGSLKSVFKAKKGSVAEINLLLDAMLRHEGITAYPVLLSTRQHGLTNEFYPLMDKFNYVICEAVINDKTYFLDASVPYLGFNRLETSCYNGHARAICPDLPRPVYLLADSLKERKLVSVFLYNDEKKEMGNFVSSLGYVESEHLRAAIRKSGESEYFRKLNSAANGEFVIKDQAIDSLKKYEFPVQVRYTLEMNKPEEDVYYFNPLMGHGYKENPFKAAERFYPVEMDHTMDETYVLNMEIPKGYEVDEIPKSVKVLFNDTEGFFEYLVSKNETDIQLRTRVVLNKATFPPEDYQSLRDFFGYIVKKQGEQIIFKKKKARP